MSRKRFWPTPAQALLLDVCLHRLPETAAQSWKKWTARVNLDDLDPASFQIIGLVSLRLVELGVDDPDSVRIKELHRHRWTQNQGALRGKTALLRSLQRVNIPTMLLGGAALARTVYPEASARGLSDTRIAVPASEVTRALQALEEEGWSAPAFDPVRSLKHSAGCVLIHPTHGEAMLHWRVLPRYNRNGQEAWWRAAQDFAYEQTPTHIPGPADHFLYACESGLRFPSGLQWLADCTFLIRRSGLRLDWLRIIKQADRFQLSLHTRGTLVYLRRHYEDSIPPEIIAEFGRASVSLENRIDYFLTSRPEKSQHDLLHKLGLAACRYIVLKESSRLGQFIRDIPKFFRFFFRKLRRKHDARP